MIKATFRPLADWPIPVTSDRRSTGHFKSGWNDTFELLEKELGYLIASQIVIEIQTTHDWIRNDGWPSSNAKVTGPKIAIYFQSKFGSLTYRCDDCSFWVHNVRCIAMTLQRLRMAEMYGVTKRGEQYQGFKQLGAGIQLDAMGIDDAKIYLCTSARMQVGELNGVTLGRAFKQAAMVTHPDRPGGSDSAFKQVQMAVEVLKRAWGIDQ